jgi:folate-binding protein YgfZ
MTSVAQSDAGVVGEVAGRAVTLQYTSLESEYAALRQSAIVVDRSHRTRMTFEGDRRLETLTGLVTNDVGSLVPGTGQYAAALTPRGKIIADLRIFARGSDLLVDVSARAAAGFVAMVRKFVNPRATKYVDRSETLADVGIFGPRAREIVASLAGLTSDALAALAPYASLTAETHSQPVFVVRTPDIGIEGYEIIVPAESRAAHWRRAIELGALPAGLDAWDTARIEAGRPEWGVDIDDTTIPQEANLDELHAISYTKGCYTGQETVARVHFRGHVNRHLRGLSYAGSAPLPRGAQLYGDGDKVIGDVRSGVVSPRLGGIALAMVRREFAPGASVRVQWEGGDGAVASVVQLPFPT